MMSPQLKRLKNLNLTLDAQKAQPDILVGLFCWQCLGENLLARKIYLLKRFTWLES